MHLRHTIMPLPLAIGQKHWQTHSGVEILLGQWGDAACTQEAHFFPEGGSLSFWIFRVPDVFSLCFHCVPQHALKMFLKFSMYTPKMFPIGPHLVPQRVPKIIFFEPIHVSQKNALLQFYRYYESKLQFEESPKFQNLFVIGQLKRLIAKKHSRLGRHLTTN